MNSTQAVILCYAAALMLYGVIFSKRAAARGRDRDPALFTAVMSLCAGFIGGGFSLGNAAAGYASGLRNAAALCGFSLGQALVARFAAPRLAHFRGARTAGDIIAQAFSGTARRFTGLFSVLFCTGVLGAQISAFGTVAGYIFHADARLCAAVGFAAVIAYTALGGPHAALRSDAVQVPALLLALFLSLVLLLPRAGGFSGLFALLPARFPSLLGEGSAASFFYLFLTFMLGEMLCPPYVARMMLSSDAVRARRACSLSAALSVPFFFISALLGMLSRALATTSTASHALPAALTAALPFPFGALALGAMLCVYLSSGGAFLNACASALVLDVLPARRTKPAAAVSAATLLCGAAALALALAFEDVLSILIVAYCFWCPAMLTPLLFALRGRRAGGRLFFLSAGFSISAVVLWRVLHEPFGIPPMLAGLLASAAVFTAYKGHKKRECV